jgi:hypothetical protein
MAAIAGTSANAEDEQAPATLAQSGQFVRQFFNGCYIDGLRNFYNFFKVSFGMHGRAIKRRTGIISFRLFPGQP